MDEKEYNRMSSMGKVINWAEFSASEVRRLKDENNVLRGCLKEALNYRPLPTDPLQTYIMQRCPDVVEEWNDERSKTPS
jgi:hypothetical protein